MHERRDCDRCRKAGGVGGSRNKGAEYKGEYIDRGDDRTGDGDRMGEGRDRESARIDADR